MEEVQNSVVFQTLPPSLPAPVSVPFPPAPPSSSSSTPNKSSMRDRREERKWTDSNDDDIDYERNGNVDVSGMGVFGEGEEVGEGVEERDFGDDQRGDEEEDEDDREKERDGDYSSDQSGSGSGNENENSASTSSSSSVSSAVSASSAGALARAAGTTLCYTVLYCFYVPLHIRNTQSHFRTSTPLFTKIHCVEVFQYYVALDNVLLHMSLNRSNSYTRCYERISGRRR